MGNYMTIVRGLTLSVSLVSIFTVLVVTVLKVIRRAAFFKGKTAVLMAVSLSLLFLVALSQFLIVPDPGSGNSVNAPVGYIYLLPGVGLTVAAAVVLSQILLLAGRTSPSEGPELLAKKSVSAVVKAKTSGRPKKEKSAEEDSKEVSRTGREATAMGEALS